MYPKEYIEFLVHFHGDRDYFECHEVLEEFWKMTEPRDKQSIWVGFILLAVANYHHRRHNFIGAKRTLTKSIEILEINKKQLIILGLNQDRLLQNLQEKLNQISKGSPYSSFNLPIIDPLLISECKELSQQKSLEWCRESDLTNQGLINRHSLRDRSAVINDRLNALKKRQ
ncbi:DUF309 domain-containing protein [Bacillus sp. Bva_UNVM-123]|uniref:DUF309 domain-containing protein n=1 Tax=Bacillus sp. Bva_UNVM-123 TaxID=2829798 RepID=UPI00391F6F2F